MRYVHISKLAIAIALSVVFLAALVSAQSGPTVRPEGPDTINISDSQRGNEQNAGVLVQAQAGNVTALSIYHGTLTNSWQGYYGNVTGAIELTNAAGTAFYRWENANPLGEIFAANGTSTDWTSVYCVNTTNSSKGKYPFARHAGDVQGWNITVVEQNFGINLTDADGLNETYNGTWTGSITVAGKTIDSLDGCSVAYPYQGGAESVVWEQLLLSDNDTIIFTGIIEQSQNAFDSSPADFQLLVLENGHTTQADSITNYYFYVELS